MTSLGSFCLLTSFFGRSPGTHLQVPPVLAQGWLKSWALALSNAVCLTTLPMPPQAPHPTPSCTQWGSPELDEVLLLHP